ncbi:MAG: TetR/AcrR family transcriptional regulator [Pseudomonadota bacterium]
MAKADRAKKNLREACLDEALALIEESGTEKLSLREVARRLGVSHQAPYKHFQSRDHILAEIVARCYADFAHHLDSRPRTGDPHEDMAEMGRHYFDYAARHPLQYRLMFNTALPPGDAHPDMTKQARHAFTLLRAALADLPDRAPVEGLPASVDLDALFVWSAIHGLVSVLHSDALDSVDIDKAALEAAIPGILARIGRGLGPAPEDR